MKKLLLILIVGMVLISGCGNEITGDVSKDFICDKPYIQVGSECCLDENDNKICDKDEKEETIKVDQKIDEEVVEEGFCNLKIDDYCCKYSEEQYSQRIWGFCDDENEEGIFLGKKEKAFKAWPSIGGVEYIEKLGLTFLAPEKWYIMKDYKMAGMDVPISYFKITDPKKPSTTEVEIRFTYYENKDNLTIEDFKEKIILLLTNGRMKNKLSFPKSYTLPLDRQTDKTRLETKRNIYNGIYFELYEYGEWDEDYYFIVILENKGNFYTILFKDPWSRQITTYYEDPAWKEYNRLWQSFMFMDYTDNVFKIKMKPDEAWGFPLNFNKPTKVRYKIVSDGIVDFYFVKSFEDFTEFIEHPRDEKFEYYEGCNHISIKGEIKGTCVITEGGFTLGNWQNQPKNVVLELDWS